MEALVRVEHEETIRVNDGCVNTQLRPEKQRIDVSVGFMNFTINSNYNPLISFKACCL